MTVTWTDLAAVPGIRVAGAPGAFALMFPNGSFAADSQIDENLVDSEWSAESIRVIAGPKPSKKKAKDSAIQLFTGLGAAPDKGVFKAARKAAGEEGWLAALACAGAGGLACAGASQRCFIEFVPTSVNSVAFETVKGPAVIVATDAKIGARSAGRIIDAILRERKGLACVAVVPASGEPAKEAGLESVSAAVLAVAEQSLKNLEDQKNG